MNNSLPNNVIIRVCLNYIPPVSEVSRSRRATLLNCPPNFRGTVGAAGSASQNKAKTRGD